MDFSGVSRRRISPVWQKEVRIVAYRWKRDEIPYDAMGDYSVFGIEFGDEEEEEAECADRDREEEVKPEEK